MKKKIFTLLILFITTLSAQAQNEAYLNLNWWQRFNDENLTNNLMVVYKNNYDLKNAALKVEENKKLVSMQFANELPVLGVSGDFNRDFRAPVQQFGQMRIPNYSQYNYRLPLTMVYEIDIWGTNRLKTKSMKEQLEISKQAERATYITLTSDFAVDYFNLIKADKMFEIQNELVESQEEIVKMVSEKYQIGLCSINELLAEEKLLSALKEERNLHKLTKDVLEETLKVYLTGAGLNNGKIVRNNYENLSLLKNIPQEFSTEIVTNRPDFKQEEANLRRIGFDVRIAKREFLPKFNIVGQVGLNAYHLGDLLNSTSQFFNAGILPSMDLFSGGRKLAFLKLQKFRYQEAVNDYEKTILEGLKEVNAGLFEYKIAIENYNESVNRFETQTKIYGLAKDKNEIGASSNIDVLYAREAYLMIKKEEVSNKINTIISTIGLYKAVGGVDLCEFYDRV